MEFNKNFKLKADYALNDNGVFTIENYNNSKTFSNFFPGIAGLWGIPMWVFYINRGQCITSFGIEAKDKAIMEFHPANKSYRITSNQGFRTFIKVKDGSKISYWEPFQSYLPGTDYKKTQCLSMTAADLSITERNEDLGLEIIVNYFTLPEESYAALIRRVSVKNIGSSNKEIEIIDGMPVIIPYGLNDWVSKHMSRTVEAWVKVRNLENKAPYYHLNVEVADTPEVKKIKEGNFFFSFKENGGKKGILSPIVEASCVFGQSNDFIAPALFLEDDFAVPEKQQTSNRSPAAMNHMKAELTPGKMESFVSVFGYAHEVEQLNEIVKQMTETNDFIARKSQRNKDLINQIKDFAFTKSSSHNFDLYVGNTFLDNILRGGLPVSLKTNDGNVAFNVYSRKHGDIERDYNYFVVAPTFYSQGNGNYRDVNQNRRNDVWFNSDVKDSHLVNFLNLIQADGYNPLVVKGTSFAVEDLPKVKSALNKYIPNKAHQDQVLDFVSKGFLPGELLRFMYLNDIVPNVDKKEFLGQILEICQKQEIADHGEGFWCDHWTYNLDLIESYLALYPEDLKGLLFDRKSFSFYHSDHYVLPRNKRYILTDKGVRQYKSVAKGDETTVGDVKDHKLKIRNGSGNVYHSNLLGKLICLIANKIASLDPNGMGVEMEADKPSWYDALNGLPGLLGSSICETLEIKRYAIFLLESFKQTGVADQQKIVLFDELATFVSGLTNLLAIKEDPLAYWNKSNDIKEMYRQRIRKGIEGVEKEVTVGELKSFLNGVVKKTSHAFESAKDENGFLTTYFFYDVKEYDILDKDKKLVKPKVFKMNRLPAFLEGYVHALRTEGANRTSLELYQKIRQSDLYDKKLKMYKVNADLSSQSIDIGRTRVFPAGWLENESIWLHMEYKLMLELLRCELYDEYYENFKNVLVPFMKPEVYGRSILENSSFLVSSAHEDQNLHGQGFVARLSGSTAEIVHMWLFMNLGRRPFLLDAQQGLLMNFNPALPGWLFTEKASKVSYFDAQEKLKETEIPQNAYAFNLFDTTLVVYHNPSRKNTFGKNKAEISEIHLQYAGQKKPVVINNSFVSAPYAKDIRDQKIERIDVIFV